MNDEVLYIQFYGKFAINPFLLSQKEDDDTESAHLIDWRQLSEHMAT